MIISTLCMPLTSQSNPISESTLQQTTQIDAEQQQRQQQQENEREAQFAKTPDIHFEKPKTESLQLPIDESNCYSISDIYVRDYGKEANQKSEFLWAYNQAVRQLNLSLPYCLGGQGINVLLRSMQNIILDKGFVTTKVVVGEQSLTSGKLVITIIPGRMRYALIEDRSDVNKFTRLTALTGLVPQQGALLNIRDIEQSLENFKHLPTADATINIVPAGEESGEIGQSDLAIQYVQTFPFRLTLGLDDSGSKSTGRLQGSLTLSLDNMFTANDLFYSSFTHSMARPTWLGEDDNGPRQSKNLSFYYSIPFRYWRLTLSHSLNDYHQQVAAAYGSRLLYAGESENSKATLSRIMFRNHQQKLTFSVSGWARQSKNYIDGREVGIQRKRTGGWEIGVNHRIYLGSATLNFHAGFKRGTGAFHARPYSEERFNEGSSRMRIITAEVSYQQPFQWLGQHFDLTTSWNAQWSKTPLIQQDRFSLGGRYTVRGTDGELSLSGERGWLWRNELAWTIPYVQQQFYVTLDKGIVRGPSTKELLGRTMIGTSVGFRGHWKAFYYDFFVGKPLYVPEGFRAKNNIVGFNLSLNF
nr:ShlB/FhaC/HecB family hemolysin secretion/activation protein [Volucribacter psittacicida]